MKHYFALAHKDADSAYGIQFPDIPGVFSASDEADDIVKNAIVALQLFAEDEALPVPSSHADIVAREEVRAELAEGAYLVSVPFIEDDSAFVRVALAFTASRPFR
ncbi:type II toxin-antitoxin system HicB family antitoxin [Ochrobactrum sp. BTU1]|jgi:predicted RNase H-like HicB family nuclease|uniref:type II toxin-antitoxin system HicB family antitoxin n=1 Tax=Ochrobactrum sp. BTU1 TaxID=2840456 RepID=UPI001C057149|nr:type II toxin-antitoxin system HicB family antitoxin [Ochrobactrum sp. BTU1]